MPNEPPLLDAVAMDAITQTLLQKKMMQYDMFSALCVGHVPSGIVMQEQNRLRLTAAGAEPTDLRRHYRERFISTFGPTKDCGDLAERVDAEVLRNGTHEAFINHVVEQVRQRILPKQRQEIRTLKAALTRKQKELITARRTLHRTDNFLKALDAETAISVIEQGIAATQERLRTLSETATEQTAALVSQATKAAAETLDQFTTQQALCVTADRALAYYRAQNPDLLVERDAQFQIAPERQHQILWSGLETRGFGKDLLMRPRVYTFNNQTIEGAIRLDPDAIRHDCLTDALRHCASLAASEKETQKISLLRELMSADARLTIDDRLGSLYKPTRGLIRAGIKEAMFAGIQAEIVKFLESKPKSAVTEALELVLSKYDPAVYRDAFRENPNASYTVTLATNAQELAESVRASGSCIEYLAGDQAQIQSMLDESGVLFLMGRTNGKPMGYARLFLMEDTRYSTFLGVDTIELDSKAFEKNRGLVCALTLASIYLGQELGVGEIGAKDGRINVGPRQSFGNTERTRRLQLLGKKKLMKTYTLTHHEEHKVYLLMHNWRAAGA